MKVLFYALGGGIGHLGRVAAVASELVDLSDTEIRLLTPSRLVDWIPSNLSYRSPPGSERACLARWFEEQLEEFQPDHLVLDLFPRGVFGELAPSYALPTSLLTRWMDPEFYRRPEIAAALSHLKVVYSSERVEGPLSTLWVQIEPLVWTRAEGSRELARQELGGGSRPLLVALGSGPLRSQSLLRDRLRRWSEERGWDLRFYSPLLESARCGVGRWLHGADMVVSSAGYQAYHEVLQCGVSAVFLPQRGPHDNQMLRSMGRLWAGPGPVPVRVPLATARTPEELETALVDLIEEPPACPITFRGASQVARHLLGLDTSPQIRT